jgi:acyl-CoA synthetase (AMP-forming)/AMP-acid ligase II
MAIAVHAHDPAQDGFFKSGDLGVMDERDASRRSEKRDMIFVSGLNVYPNELEQVIGLHPGVLGCAAIGWPTRNRARRTSPLHHFSAEVH